MLTRNGTRSGYLLFFFKQKFCITTNVDDSFLFEISSLHLFIVELFMFFKDAFFFGIANRK